jgi:hypothetical protein
VMTAEILRVKKEEEAALDLIGQGRARWRPPVPVTRTGRRRARWQRRLRSLG